MIVPGFLSTGFVPSGSTGGGTTASRADLAHALSAIPAGMTHAISAGEQYIVFGDLRVDGNLVIDGELVVIR